MADIVKFKSGSKDNLLGAAGSNALPIIPGTVYFAIDNDNKGYLYFDKDSTHRIWMGMADHANSATYDNNNRKIEDTYLKGITFDGTTNTAKVTAILEKGSGDTTTKVDLPNAGASSAGIITTGAQTIAGNKTLTGAFVSSGGATFSNSNFDYSGMEVGTANAARIVWFSDNSKRGKPVYDADFTYNPSTNTLTVTNITGTASRATADAAGNNIQDTYVKKAGDTVTGRLTFTKMINQIITGTGTAGRDAGSGASPRYFPAKWTFNTGSAPTDGDIITIKIPIAGHDYGVFLSVNNGTNYHPVVTNGTGRVTTHYPVNTYLTLIYESTGSAASMFAVNGANSRATVSGGVWRVLNYYDSNSNTIPSAYCTTAAGTAAKAASCSNYVATAKSYLHVLIQNANTAANALTLNVNSQGAKPIFINGVASGASNYTLPAGSYIVYYDGTNYQFRTDGILPGAIERASKDAAGNSIADTYIAKNIGTTKGDIIYWDGDSSPVRLAIGSNGQVLKVNSNGVPAWSSDSNTDTKVKLTSTSTSGNYPIVFGPTSISSGNAYEAYYNTNIKVNPNTGTITATTFDGTATKAVGDGIGNNIQDNYASSLSLVNTYTLKLLNNNGSELSSVTLTDTKNTAGSTQKATKIFIIGAESQAANPQTYSSSKVYITDGTVTATTFAGNLSGNAATATKATQDSGGQQINTTYLKGWSVNNSTNVITLTRGDGNTSTITGPWLLLTGGQVTGPVTFGDAVTADEITIGDLLVNGSANFTNGLRGNLTGNVTGNLTGTASRATADSQGQQINATYLKDWSVNNATVTLTKGDGSTTIRTLPSITIGASSVAPGGTLTSITGPLAIKTSADATKAFFIQRSGSGEQTAIWVDDSYTYFDVTNDETTANIRFTLHATDTESGGGAGAQTSYVTFNGVNGKSTVVADNFTGTASRATADGAGNNIQDTYIPKSIGTTKGDIIYWSSNKTPVRLGIGSNGQVLKVNSSGVPAWSSDSNTDTKVTQSASTTSNWRKILLHYKDDSTADAAVTSSTEQVYAAVNVAVQPSTGTIKATKFDGTATRATADAGGNNIQDTYIPKSIGTAKGDIIYWTANNAPARLAASSDGKVLKLSGGVPVWSDDNNSDTKVTQTAVTYTDYTNWRPLIWGASNSGTEGFTPSTVTDGVFTASSLSVQPSTGTIRATTFKGTATRATADAGGNNIQDTYAKKDGTNATGTWPINISGTAANADKVDNYHAYEISGTRTYNTWTKTSTTGTAWFPIYTLADSVDGSALFIVKAYAHSSIIFTATKGYSNGSVWGLNILGGGGSYNNSYATIQGVRITKDGVVELGLNATATNVDINVRILSSAIAKTPIESLVEDTGSPAIATSYTGINVVDMGIRSNSFTGKLIGTATYADKATGDTTNIKDTYISSITSDAANHKITYIKGSGSGTDVSLPYVKLSGDTMTGTLQFQNVAGIKIASNNTDIKIWEVDGDAGSWASTYGFHELYKGSGSGNDNTLELYAHNQSGTHKKVRTIKQDGTVTWHQAQAMDSTLTFNTTNGILYKGTQATSSMIRFKDNTSDAYGNGIIVGGGGVAIMGGGEAADSMATQYNGGDETLALGSDGAIHIYTNLQDGIGSSNQRKYIWNNGTLSATEVFTISSNSTLYLNSGSNTSLIFNKNNTEIGRWNASGNLMVGTISDQNSNTKYKLYVNGNSYSKSLSRDNFISFPDGGFGSGDGTVVGAIKITLPVSWTATMMMMKVDIYNYNDNNAITYTIGGYNYTGSNGYWVNCSSHSTGLGDKANLTVRFGHDGTKCCIIIGEVDTSWSYPKVQVRDVVLGHSGTTISNWSDGWSISWITTLPSNINVSKSNPAVIPLNHGGTGATTRAGARTNLETWAFVVDSYNTLMPPDGTTNGWVKIGTSNTSYGLLPSAAGGAGNGHNYIGTSSWYWKYAYIDQIYGYLNGNISGSAASATKTGVASIWLYPENSNELNFGGTNTSTTLYIGYRAKDSRAIPTKFIFGGANGSADLQVKTVYLGSGTTSYISNTDYTGKAARATADANGDNIRDTYVKTWSWDATNKKIIVTKGSGATTEIASPWLPLTGGQVTGAVTFGSSVTIDEATIGDLIVNGSASFTNGLRGNVTGNVTGNLTGVASRATADAAGNNIQDTYINKTGAAGDILYWSAQNTPAHLAKGSNGQVLKMNSSGVPVWSNDSNTDTKVTQSASTTSNWRKILLHYKDDSTADAAVTSSTEQVYAAVGVAVQPSTGTIKATKFDGIATRATGDAAGNNIQDTYVKKAGDTMTGVLTTKGSVYDDAYTGALNLNNSNIYGVNSIYTADLADSSGEGIHFYRTATTVDTIWIKNGIIYFTPNRTLGTSGTSYTVIHSNNYTDYTVTKTGGGASGTWGISISGNAATATSATSATNDSSSNKIVDTYIKTITGDTTNHKITYTKGSGGTIDVSLPYVRTAGDTITGILKVDKTIRDVNGQHFYGGAANRSQWYKITLPMYGLTLPASNQWYMTSMTIHVAGDYSSAPRGTVELCYYIYWNQTACSADKVYATAIGPNINKLKIYYSLSDPFVLYVDTNNAYTSLWVDYASYRDSAQSHNTKETKVETTNAITVANFLQVPIVNLYTAAGGSWVMDKSLSVTGSVTASSGFSGDLSGNASTATSAGKLTTARTLWGQSFNGTANISGNMTDVGNVTHTTETANIYRINRKKADGGGWAYAPIRVLGNDNAMFSNIGVYGGGDVLTYTYIGSGDYNSNINLRIAPNGDVTAKKFIGPLEGTATRASADAAGNNIQDTYVKKSGDTITGQVSNTARYWGTAPTRDSGAFNFPNANHDETTSGTYYRPWLSGSEGVNNKGYGNAWSMGLYTTGANNTDMNNVGYYMGTAWDGNATTTYVWQFTRGGSSYFPGKLELYPTAGSYQEGLRIHSYSSWSDITLCGNDNTGTSGISANSWFIGNNNGSFYIARNGSSSSSSAILQCVSNIWEIYNDKISTALGIDTNLKIGTGKKTFHIRVNNGSGTGINDGYAGAITFGDSSSAYAGIYYQSSGSYGSRLHFATTGSYANGAYSRMMIDSAGNVGINTLSPASKLHINGGLLKITNNSNTVTIGSANTGWCHIENSANIPFYFNRIISATTGYDIYDGHGSWRDGYLQIIAKSGGDAYLELNRNTNANWRFLDSGGTFYLQSDYTTAKTSYYNVLTANYNTGNIVLRGNLNVGATAGGIGLANTSGSTGIGISLYGGPTGGIPEYGIAFAGTSSFGKYGDVQSDWATYFTMNGNDQRGWIFKTYNQTAEDYIAASISKRGIGTFKGITNPSGYVAFPQGGSYTTSTATVTGALKITLPQYKTNTMMQFDINIFTYEGANRNSVIYHVGGYEYGDSGWYNNSSRAYSEGYGPHANLTVRFGYDGSKACVTIGETTTTWNYPQVEISNIVVGYSNYTADKWGYGWTVGFVTELPSSISGTYSNVNAQMVNVIGTNGATSPAGALLQSGPNRTDNAAGDSWIFWDTLGGATSPWGFKHNQASNDIEFYGSGTKRVTIHLGSSKVTATTFDGKSTSSGIADKVVGSYTGNGGQQNPNYFGTNKVGFLMMNTPVNGNSQYKDWILMDCYSGNDVGGGVALGVNRQSLGAYIMRSASGRSAWEEKAELVGTHNYADIVYTIPLDVSSIDSTTHVAAAGADMNLYNSIVDYASDALSGYTAPVTANMKSLLYWGLVRPVIWGSSAITTGSSEVYLGKMDKDVPVISLGTTTAIDTRINASLTALGWTDCIV